MIIYLVVLDIVAVASAYYVITLRTGSTVKTYIEEKAEKILSSVNPRVVEAAGRIVEDASSVRLVFFDDELVVTPSATVEISYPCPVGVRIHLHLEPELKASHVVDEQGVCRLIVRNEWEDAVSVRVTAYSDGGELMRDDAYRTYAVFEWIRRHLRYIPDPSGFDVLFEPAETLARGGGDCEDLALTAASLLRALNVTAGVVLVNTGSLNAKANHVAVVVKQATRFFFNNLKLYYGVHAVACKPVVIDEYLVLDPVLSASSAIPWCTPYSVHDVVAVTT